MATPIGPPSTGSLPEEVAPGAERDARPGFLRHPLLIVGAVVLIFLLTYAFAWLNAYRLSDRFMADADDSLEREVYLEALVGGDEFDPQTNRNVKKGGYLSVEKIWSSAYSWPEPAIVERARERSQEVIYERLTIEMAERYIRANTGRPAPYFAEIYLRLGELYEQDGDLVSAQEIYESIPDLFPRRTDLIEQAEEHLERLE
jgi:hypothetical protein